MKKKVIIDLGAHKGEDTDFYLKKGFKVIAIEASEKLYEEILQKIKSYPNNDDLTVYNYAITDKDDDIVVFHENENSVWGTIFESWDYRNQKLGTTSNKKTIHTKRLDTLIKQQLEDDEVIEYIKIDIEGADTMALQALSNLREKPKFVSIESEKVVWEKLLEEFALFKKLGYSKFKIIDQSKIQFQRCPFPSREGKYVDYKFEPGSSGLFGEELPGEWMSAEEAIKFYKKIFLRYRLFGDYGIFNNRLIMQNKYFNKLMQLLKLKYPHVGWFDTHASL